MSIICFIDRTVNVQFGLSVDELHAEVRLNSASVQVLANKSATFDRSQCAPVLFTFFSLL